MSKKGGHILHRYSWLLLFAAAVVLTCVSVRRSRGTDYTDTVARSVSSVLSRRMELLDGYVEKAAARRHDPWLDLEDLPEDMVIYLYAGDTLRSWCHRFSIDNDDIGRRMVIQRFPNLRNNLVSPLTQVDTALSYLNIGPKWYLTYSRTDGEGCTLIAGLEVKDSMDGTTVNGVNPRLHVPDHFSLHPISWTGGAPVSVRGRPLLRIVRENARPDPLLPSALSLWTSVFLVIAGAFLFLNMHKSRRNLLLVLGGLTVLMAVFYVLGRSLETTSELFSPNVYADGSLRCSLGAVLIINTWVSVIICCFYTVRSLLLRSVYLRPGRFRAAGIILAVLLVALPVYVYLSFRSIIVNSNITLELYKVHMLSRFTAYVYLSYTGLLLTIPLLLQMLRPILRRWPGLRYNVFSRTFRTVFSILCAVFLVSVTSLLGFRRESRRVEIWANRLAIDRDLAFEIQLRGAENAIANDPLIATLVSGRMDYRIILNRITENYLARIAQEYDLTLYIFHGNEADAAVLSYFNERIMRGTPISDNSRFLYSRTNGRPQYTGVFTYYSPSDGVTRLLLGVESKAEKQGRGYASLLDNSAAGPVVLPYRYSYAKYIDDKLVSYRGDFAYPTVLTGGLRSADEAGEDYVIMDGYVHFLDRISEDEFIVISRKNEDFTQYMVAGFMAALFAFFCLSLLALGNRRKGVFEKNYYKTRMNTVLFLSLIATLLVMTVISVLFIYRRNEANLMNLMTTKIGTIQALVRTDARFFRSVDGFDSQEAAGRLNDIGEYTKSDITLYTVSGKEYRSTNQDVFDRMLVPSRVDGNAYRSIIHENLRYYIHKERLGRRSFYMMYAPVINDAGTMLAILAAPYTDSEAEFRTEAVFHSIFIITAFLILLILARWVTTRQVDKMFRPLVDMGRKMTSARTGGLEYIIYDREDEIASLVRAYNLMVHDLSESSKQAAQIERDKAWSEMARQVAHEIKNPLTPIKLQIQRIIRLKSRGDESWSEKFEQMAPVILESIDGLTDTANEFSTFAKLYSEEPVEIDLDRLLSDEVALFDEKENISFQYIGLQGARVKGPKPQLTRVFVNLLTNAVQAIESRQREKSEGGAPEQGRIHVSLRNSTRGDCYDIVVEDNGPGVGDENRARLFTPNFTTKSGGTGLGLAICKNILERCGGEISYSRSFTLGGACFTVRFPKFDGAGL